MTSNVDYQVTVESSRAGEDNLRLASVLRDGRRFAERVRLADPSERVHFAARALRGLGVDVSREGLAELDQQLMRAADVADGRRESSGGPRIVRFSDMKSEEVSWLWPGRIARGAITLLAGDPGLGKSLVTLDIAARVSRGVDWPDGARGLGRSGSVVLLSGEDHLQQTILPRLEGMGADMSRLVTVEPRRDALRGEDSSQFELDRDMDELRRTVDALGDCALIVLDPISAFLGRTGECSNADVRRLLAPLAELARQRQVAVLFVVHLRKDMGPAVRRALGSMAFMAVSRAAWLVLRDPMHQERRLMIPVKNNLSTDADGLAYEVVGSMEETLSGKPPCEDAGGGGVAVVKWSTERFRKRADEVIMASSRRAQRPDTERREAIAWLRECLTLGPRGAVELRELAEQHGFAFRTVQRAFRELQGVAWKDRSVRHGGWQWALPGAGGQVEEWSGGVVEEERQPEGEVEDAGSARELKPLFPVTAEMIEGEKRLLEILRRNDEEVAAFAARMKAEERELGRHVVFGDSAAGG